MGPYSEKIFFYKLGTAPRFAPKSKKVRWLKILSKEKYHLRSHKITVSTGELTAISARLEAFNLQRY